MPEVSTEDFDVICLPEVRSLVKCVFCKNDLTKETEEITGAHLLVCFHSVCRKCVEGWSNSDTKLCPECRVDIPKDLIDHKLLQEVVEKPYSESTRKGVCGMHPNTQATRWCHQCTSLVCDECIKVHDQLKGTKTHDIVDAIDILPASDLSLVKFNCELHPSMQFEIFCLKCEMMTCRNCQLEHHRQHNEYEFIADHCKEYKIELLKKQKRMGITEKTMESSQNAALLLQNNLRAKKEDLRKKIVELHQRIVLILENRVKQLLKELDTVMDADMRVIEDQMSTTSQFLVPLKHCIQIVDLMLQASDNTVMHSKKHLDKCLKLLLDRYVELPNHDVKKTFSFHEGENIPQLIEQLSTIGKISLEMKNTGKPGMADIAMYLPILEEFGLMTTDSDVKTAEKPPGRIHLRQDLQSPEGFKSMERVSTDSRASASPEVAVMLNWHTPQGPPVAKVPPPAVMNHSVTVPNAGANNLKLKDLLTTSQQQQFVQLASTPYANTQVSQQPNAPNQRMMPQEPSALTMNSSDRTDTRSASTHVSSIMCPTWPNQPRSTVSNHQSDPIDSGSRFVNSEVTQQQMHCGAMPVQSMQPIPPPPPYNYHPQPATRTYSITRGGSQRRQSDPPLAPALYHSLFRCNNVSITPTNIPFPQQPQQTSHMIQQQTAQQQVVQMQSQPAQQQVVQMQSPPMQQQQPIHASSFQGQGAQIQPQHIQYMPQPTHSPYNK